MFIWSKIGRRGLEKITVDHWEDKEEAKPDTFGRVDS